MLLGPKFHSGVAQWKEVGPIMKKIRVVFHT